MIYNILLLCTNNELGGSKTLQQPRTVLALLVVVEAIPGIVTAIGLYQQHSMLRQSALRSNMQATAGRQGQKEGEHAGQGYN